MEHQQDARLAAGTRVTWVFVPKGGYGYAQRVPAEVVRVTRARVVIRVQTWNGEWVRRAVRPSSLRMQEQEAE